MAGSRNGRGNGARGNANSAMMEMLRGIVARLDAIEMTQRRGRPVDVVSDEEVEEKEGREREDQPGLDQGEERFIKALTRANTKPHLNPLDYNGKLDSNELLDWIIEMEKYFDFEGTTEDKKVKFSCTKLKGHAPIWWEHL